MRNTNSCTLRIPPDVEYLLEKIHEAGFDVWLVGGAIRDFLYGWPPKDWDLATEASPQEIIRLFPRVIPVGIRHDTVQVYTGERAIEVTSYRSRGAEGILSDLGRRDFTVNALAMAYPNRTVIDLFAGRHDLQAGILRAVGDARARFSEDPLRALRAGRFVSVYGLSIEENTFAALTDEAEKLGSVAVERIRTEMFKLLLGDNVFSAFEWMRRGKVLGQIFPEVLEGHDESGRCKEDVYRHLLLSVQQCPRKLTVRLAALFHDIGKPRVQALFEGGAHHPGHHQVSALTAFDVLSRWRASRKTIREVTKLVEKHIPTDQHHWSDAQIRHMIADLGPDLLDNLLEIAYADRLAAGGASNDLHEIESLCRRARLQLEARPPLRIRDLALDGNDLMRAFYLEPGPSIGKILQDLHRMVLDDPAKNERRILLDHVRKRILNGSA